MRRVVSVLVAGLVVASVAMCALGCKGKTSAEGTGGGNVSADAKSKMQGVQKQVETKAGKGAAGGS